MTFFWKLKIYFFFRRLHRFARDWLEYNLPNEKQRSRIRERLEHWGVRLQRAYNREQCGYFDPGSPNAADPNPEVNQKLNKKRKSRARRDIDDYDEWMVSSFVLLFKNLILKHEILKHTILGRL